MVKHINNYTVEYWTESGMLTFWAYEVVDSVGDERFYLDKNEHLTRDYKDGVLGFSGTIGINDTLNIVPFSNRLVFGGMKDFEEWVEVIKELYALADTTE